MKPIMSIIDNGTASSLIRVECRMTNSLPAMVIVGFTHRSIVESKERIRGALSTCKVKLPPKRIIINLAPADIPKEGSSFDMAIMVAILVTAYSQYRPPDDDTALLGEVGLDGSIRPIRGIIGKMLAAQARGITTFWIPLGNIDQAQLIKGITIHPFSHTKELLTVLCGAANPPIHNSPHSRPQRSSIRANDEVVGQERAKRALVIAAAGQHHMLLSGLPGTGKSMLAQMLRPLLPAMNRQEILEATQIHSLVGKDFNTVITERPLQQPHHTVNPTGLFGSGNPFRPGSIGLGHRGVLLLDEFPEFSRASLESLRQPLENRSLTVTRPAGSITLPASFILVATANPCPCGYYGSNRIACTCTPNQVLYYQRKLSGPLMDRIDLYCETEPIHHPDLIASRHTQSIDRVQKQIENAQNIQYERTNALNGTLNDLQLKQTTLASSARALLDASAVTFNLSARAYLRTLRVARTIADLEESLPITDIHVAEALQYRYRPSLIDDELTSVP